MEETTKKYDIGVIIGRFQTHELHEAHKAMIEKVISKHDKVILFLGVAPSLVTKRNPLDFMTRKAMIENEYGNKISIILPLNDKKSDYVWSKQVDTEIRKVFPMGSAVLYGSRDSFISHYKGKNAVIELVSSTNVSATEARDSISKKIGTSKDFRAGIIYAAYNNYPIVHPVIDVAILNEDETHVLLGRKKEEEEFRFIGGFADVTDESLEHTVRREALEETGLEIGDIQYIASIKVKDWRYRSDSERSIMTSFFRAKRVFGNAKGADDIAEVKWFAIKDVNGSQIVGEHANLLRLLKENLTPIS